jgi:hypothetical protein
MIVDPEVLMINRGFVFRSGQQFYVGEPDYVWFESGDTEVRVRYTDGAEVLYPVSAFDYIVTRQGGVPK